MSKLCDGPPSLCDYDLFCVDFVYLCLFSLFILERWFSSEPQILWSMQFSTNAAYILAVSIVRTTAKTIN